MGGLNGFIKIHRKLIEWGWYSNSVVKDVFIHILMIATFKEGYYQGQKLNPGDAIIGVKRLADELGFSVQQVRTALKKLESTKEISLKSTNRFTVATVVNWEFYQLQDGLPTNEQQTDNNPLTNEQQSINKQSTNEQQTNNKQSTNEQQHLKNVKKDKNVKNGENVKNHSRTRAHEEDDESRKSSAPSFAEVEDYCTKIGLVLPRALYRYCEEVIGFEDWETVARSWATGEVPPEALRG